MATEIASEVEVPIHVEIAAIPRVCPLAVLTADRLLALFLTPLIDRVLGKSVRILD